MGKHKKKKPEIRFKGFTDDWEQRKLGEVVERIVRKNLNMDSALPLTISAQYGLIAQSEFFDKRVASKDLSGYYLLYNGEFAYNKSTSADAPWGAIKRLDRYEKGVLSTLYIVFAIRNLDIIDSNYLVTYYDNDVWYKDVSAIAAEGARNHGLLNIAPDDFFATTIKKPKSITEQKQIGKYFDKIDNLITLHQRKLEKWKKVKKSMLEKMFPQNGEKEPQIRFCGFNSTWEQRKLFDCIEKIVDFRGRTPKKLGMDWSNEGYLALSALNVKNGYIDFNQDVHYGDQKLYDKWMIGNELHKGQVLFTTEAPMGNVAQVPDCKQYILSQRAIAFVVRDNVVVEDFLAVVLRSTEIQNKLLALQSGGTAKGVSQKSLSTLKIKFPVSIKEQMVIAQGFQHLDNLITLHQRKLEKLKKIKKAMLEKMFV